ncbi:hypothetical protein [Pseudomonas sp. YL-218 TE3947]|jgi:hypothetical protein|uniref:hypothetical protein n=1 Tax=Pseudomonas TaxID=286 RepID=UPI003D1D597C
MALYAVATVDLDGGVSSSARNVFNEELKKEKFAKHKLTTLWTVRYMDGWTKATALKDARDSIDKAARIAGIAKYEALVSLADEAPTEWRKPTILLGA